jgi:PIN domain nuclease of toxin-antitoxin system
VKILLDTCTLLWATLSPDALSQRAQALIASEDSVVLVSAASAWEIATKVRLGKLPGIEKLEENYLETMDAAGYTSLPIDTAHALRVGRMTADRRDPFDRMLAAQAIALDAPILSPDTQLDGLGARRIW